MMASTYSTWEFYSCNYKGQLDQDTYTRLAIRAKGMIDYYTRGGAAGAPESMVDNLAYAECELVDAISSFDSVSLSGGISGVSSVNNDGYSISFSSTARTDQQKRTLGILQTYLTYPINLMSSAARVRNIQRQNHRCWGWRDAYRW